MITATKPTDEITVEISTESFRRMKAAAIGGGQDWTERTNSPTQRLTLALESYNRLVDDAIDKRLTLDQWIAKYCPAPAPTKGTR